MILEIVSKLFSESLLSFYPIFVKYINIPLFLQIESRFLVYSLISLFFVDFAFLYKHITTINAFGLSLTTLLHIYTSYRGFQLLESGIAYVLFYTYPIFILLFSGAPFQHWLWVSLVGVYILSSTQTAKKDSETETFEAETTKPVLFKKTEVKEHFKYEGIIMILMAALTEAMIYFLVRRIKTDNHWNHMLLSYGPGAILFFALFFRDMMSPTFSTAIFSASMGINLVIGLFGYLLRFYAISALEPVLYSTLSYFGIFMSYVYGVVFGGDTITTTKLLGTFMVLFPSIITTVFRTRKV